MVRSTCLEKTAATPAKAAKTAAIVKRYSTPAWPEAFNLFFIL